MREMDLTMPVDQSAAFPPHPRREGNERVFLFGWIWMSSRYSQSWSLLYLPVTKA